MFMEFVQTSLFRAAYSFEFIINECILILVHEFTGKEYSQSKNSVGMKYSKTSTQITLIY